MMLGKPVVSCLNIRESEPRYELQALKEAPIVSATVDTIYDVLKDLVANPEKRRRIGEESRRYAVKWHGMTACAARYEGVYDRLFPSGGPLSE
jgi:glycosyltransferase involved in cell wall biosynthesis